jgi:hypothetical protein
MLMAGLLWWEIMGTNGLSKVLTSGRLTSILVMPLTLGNRGIMELGNVLRKELYLMMLNALAKFLHYLISNLVFGSDSGATDPITRHISGKELDLTQY